MLLFSISPLTHPRLSMAMTKFRSGFPICTILRDSADGVLHTLNQYIHKIHGQAFNDLLTSNLFANGSETAINVIFAPVFMKRKFVPTRLIHIVDSDQTLKLVENIGRVDYITLSHRWGNPTQKDQDDYSTTEKNHKTRCKGFSRSDLPKTFQDAVEVTRMLGKRYLWIDALCIIQDDGTDLTTELQFMDKIYSSSYCTIAASSASSWKEGFLERKSAPYYIQLQGGQ